MADPSAAAKDALAALRAMSSTEYVFGSTAGALSASVVFSPVVASFAFVNGILGERYFKERTRGHTFASLARAGAVSSFGTTARVAAWVVGTTALSATLREGARLGPRHIDYSDVDAVTFILPSFAVNAISGAAIARLIATPRTPVIVAAFALGPLLPYALAHSSGYTQRSLRRLSGQLSGAAPGQG